MKLKSILITAMAILALAGCKKYEPQYDGPYKDGDEQAVFNKYHEILFVKAGVVHLTTPYLDSDKILLNTPSNVKRASINYSHDLIACWAPGLPIVVLDSNDVQIATIAGTENVEWFDWHPNNQTLVILDDGVISLYGPNVTMASTDLNDVFPFVTSGQRINSVAVGADGTVYFTYQYDEGFNEIQRFGIRYPAGAGLNDREIYIEGYYAYDALRVNQDASYITINASGNSIQNAYTYTPADDYFRHSFGSVKYEVYSPDGQFSVFHDDYSLRHGQLPYSLSTNGSITALDW
ncbi:MAG: hypothetical protein IT258_12685 [Saprospiraceae bacterium]|nr:hypothetical protein [Saprospiraceae bacterium]